MYLKTWLSLIKVKFKVQDTTKNYEQKKMRNGTFNYSQFSLYLRKTTFRVKKIAKNLKLLDN